MPRPRNESAVSPRIMPGIASVAESDQMLMKLGIKWRKMMRIGLAPHQFGGNAEILLAQRTASASARRWARPVQSMRPRMTVDGRK